MEYGNTGPLTNRLITGPLLGLIIAPFAAKLLLDYTRLPTTARGKWAEIHLNEGSAWSVE